MGSGEVLIGALVGSGIGALAKPPHAIRLMIAMVQTRRMAQFYQTIRCVLKVRNGEANPNTFGSEPCRTPPAWSKFHVPHW